MEGRVVCRGGYQGHMEGRISGSYVGEEMEGAGTLKCPLHLS